MLQRLATGFCCAVLLWLVPAGADQWDKKTIVTFSSPVELPGVVLPAGTYVRWGRDQQATKTACSSS